MRSTLQSDTAGEHLIYASASLPSLTFPKPAGTPYPGPQTTAPDFSRPGHRILVDRVNAVERIGT
jgi:hypothetical protein